MLKGLWAAIKCGSHHGKGIKLKNQGKNEAAIEHFIAALRYAEKTENDGTVAYQMECIAITYHEMKKPTEAKEYAESSLKLYKILAEQSKDDIFVGATSRVEQLLSDIRT